jgi:hypothetical protein
MAEVQFQGPINPKQPEAGDVGIPRRQKAHHSRHPLPLPPKQSHKTQQFIQNPNASRQRLLLF